MQMQNLVRFIQSQFQSQNGQKQVQINQKLRKFKKQLIVVVNSDDWLFAIIIYLDMRPAVYIIAYIGHMMVYILRNSYMYSKPFFKAQFKFTTMFVCIMDSALLSGIGLSSIMRYFFDNVNPRLNHYRSSAINSFFFYSVITLVPIIYTFSSKNLQIILICSIFLYGLPMSYFQPVLITKIKKYYSQEDNELLMAFWHASSHIGKALGFFYMSAAIMDYKIKWNVALTLINFAALTVHLCIYFYFKNVEPYDQHQIVANYNLSDSNRTVVSEQFTINEFLAFCIEYFAMKEARYLLLTVCCYKGIFQNFAIWVPLYLYNHNYKELIGQALLIFVLPSAFGSFILFKMDQVHNASDRIIDSSCFLIISALLSILCLFGFLNYHMNYIQFLILILFEGILVGGIYNVVVSRQEVSQNFSGRQREMMRNLFRCMTHLMGAFFNLIIGVVINIRQQNKFQSIQETSFELLLVISIFSFVILIYWLYLLYEKQHQIRQRQGDQLVIQA